MTNTATAPAPAETKPAIFRFSLDLEGVYYSADGTAPSPHELYEALDAELECSRDYPTIRKVTQRGDQANMDSDEWIFGDHNSDLTVAEAFDNVFGSEDE